MDSYTNGTIDKRSGENMVKKNKTLQIKESQLKKIKADATTEAVQVALTIFLYTLKEKKGYSVRSLKQLGTQINSVCDCINSEHLKYSDIRDWFLEAGIDIKKLIRF